MQFLKEAISSFFSAIIAGLIVGSAFSLILLPIFYAIKVYNSL